MRPFFFARNTFSSFVFCSQWRVEQALLRLKTALRRHFLFSWKTGLLPCAFKARIHTCNFKHDIWGIFLEIKKKNVPLHKAIFYSFYDMQHVRMSPEFALKSLKSICLKQNFKISNLMKYFLDCIQALKYQNPSSREKFCWVFFVRTMTLPEMKLKLWYPRLINGTSPKNSKSDIDSFILRRFIGGHDWKSVLKW